MAYLEDTTSLFSREVTSIHWLKNAFYVVTLDDRFGPRPNTVINTQARPKTCFTCFLGNCALQGSYKHNVSWFSPAIAGALAGTKHMTLSLQGAYIPKAHTYHGRTHIQRAYNVYIVPKVHT